MHPFSCHYQTPYSKTLLIACDSNYFMNWGQHCVRSALDNKVAIHCHVVNPTDNILRDVSCIDFKNFSFSYNVFDFSKYHMYERKAYLYTLRYFIALDFFQQNLCHYICILDADTIIKNNPLEIQSNFFVSYSANAEHDWKKVGGNFVIFHIQHKEFVKKLCENIIQKFSQIPDEHSVKQMNKYHRGNTIGLDQSCLAITLKELNYSNCIQVPNTEIPLVSKHQSVNSYVWSLTGGNKKNNPQIANFLQNKYAGIIGKNF